MQRQRRTSGSSGIKHHRSGLARSNWPSVFSALDRHGSWVIRRKEAKFAHDSSWRMLDAGHAEISAFAPLIEPGASMPMATAIKAESNRSVGFLPGIV
jgi:hypothetical protein